jgi:hypothetical protein
MLMLCLDFNRRRTMREEEEARWEGGKKLIFFGFNRRRTRREEEEEP